MSAAGLAIVCKFLLGEGPLDGAWFGDSDTAKPRARYWWREHLRAALAAPVAAGQQADVTPFALGRQAWSKEAEMMESWAAPVSTAPTATLVDAAAKVIRAWRDSPVNRKDDWLRDMMGELVRAHDAALSAPTAQSAQQAEPVADAIKYNTDLVRKDIQAAIATRSTSSASQASAPKAAQQNHASDEYEDCAKCKGSRVLGEVRGVRCSACNGSATVKVSASAPKASVHLPEDQWHSLTCDGTCSPPCKDAPKASGATDNWPVQEFMGAARVALVSLAHAAEKHGIYQTDYERFAAAIEKFRASTAATEAPTPTPDTELLAGAVWNGPNTASQVDPRMAQQPIPTPRSDA